MCQCLATALAVTSKAGSSEQQRSGRANMNALMLPRRCFSYCALYINCVLALERPHVGCRSVLTGAHVFFCCRCPTTVSADSSPAHTRAPPPFHLCRPTASRDTKWFQPWPLYTSTVTSRRLKSRSWRVLATSACRRHLAARRGMT